ncbi:MAG: N-acetylmuramoyl-L-alanine amidase [Blautia sp.]
MKKIYIVMLGILTVVLAVLLVVTVSQAEKVNAVRSQVAALRKEAKKLEQQATEKENSREELEKQLADAKEKRDAMKQEKEVVEEQESQELDEGSNEETDAEEPEAGNGRKVAIDPGHQGYNVDMSDTEPLGPGSQEMKQKATTGTQGKFTGVPEFELNLNISKQLQEELEKRGYEVMLTRQDNDTAISNRERALLAASFGADIYVRIHANGSDDTSVNGAFTMIPSSENPYVANLHEKSYALGEAVINAYCESCGIKNSGVQCFDNMTGINWSKVPVIILEMGFMSNESDDRNMQDPDFQVLMVQGIANGIDQYFAAGNE